MFLENPEQAFYFLAFAIGGLILLPLLLATLQLNFIKRCLKMPIDKLWQHTDIWHCEANNFLLFRWHRMPKLFDKRWRLLGESREVLLKLDVLEKCRAKAVLPVESNSYTLVVKRPGSPYANQPSAFKRSVLLLQGKEVVIEARRLKNVNRVQWELHYNGQVYGFGEVGSSLNPWCSPYHLVSPQGMKAAVIAPYKRTSSDFQLMAVHTHCPMELVTMACYLTLQRELS